MASTFSITGTNTNGAATPVTFDILHGAPIPPSERIETWVVPGVDGYGAQTLGQGDSDFECVSINFFANSGGGSSANDAANTQLTNCFNLKGETIAILDDWGDSYANLLVVDVKPVPDQKGRFKQPIIYQGYSGSVLMQLRWTMINLPPSNDSDDEDDD